MRKWIMAATFALITGQVSAQDVTIRDIFKQMPDSLMPYLSQNNRLDFIDFLDSNMKAEVRNTLGRTSEMTALADDSLTIRMSESLKTDLLLLPLAQPVDSFLQVVVMVETFLVDSIYGESRVSYFTPDWQRLPSEPEMSAAEKKKINGHILQNILKKDEEVINKR